MKASQSSSYQPLKQQKVAQIYNVQSSRNKARGEGERSKPKRMTNGSSKKQVSIAALGQSIV